MPEVWRSVPEFPGYDVSSYGQVRTYWRKTSKGRGHGGWAYELSPVPVGLLKGTPDKDGYILVTLSRNGRTFRKRIHRLVLESFRGLDGARPIPNHQNNVKYDNRLENLKWSTVSENTLHANDIGVGQRGESHHRARLTVADVLQIRATVSTRAEKLAAAKVYACTVENIDRIVTRRAWRHV